MSERIEWMARARQLVEQHEGNAMTSQAEHAHVVVTIQRAMEAAIVARDVADRYNLGEGCERIKWALDFLNMALEKVRESKP